MAKVLSSRRRPLSQERILETAIELIDREGLEGFSMRHLGAALGVEAMALYRHFPSKTALLESVAARLLSELEFPEPGARWQDSLRTLARDYRALLLRHPNAIPIMATLQLTNPGALGAAGAVMVVLRAAGFDSTVAFHVLATAVSYIIGSAQWEAGTLRLRGDGDARPALPPNADPYIAENWDEIAAADCTIAFEFGLDLLIAGLERERAS